MERVELRAAPPVIITGRDRPVRHELLDVLRLALPSFSVQPLPLPLTVHDRITERAAVRRMNRATVIEFFVGVVVAARAGLVNGYALLKIGVVGGDAGAEVCAAMLAVATDATDSGGGMRR